jgi:transcriptional regulator with XRE-family HTH domain
VGDHIRARRLDLGLIQRETAQEIGVTEQTLYHWERGKTEPPARFWPGIIRFLGYVPMQEPKSLSDKLRYARHMLGLTRPAFARKLGVDDSTLARWEAGSTRPYRKTPERIESLAQSLTQGTTIG